MLVTGAEALVRGAASMAKKMSIPEIAIGLTVVALGTSAPELVVNTFAAVGGQHAIVFGNIIGSNMANILLILGVAGLIYPLTVQKNTVWKEIPFLLFATLVVFFLVYDSWRGDESANWLSRSDGLILLGLFCIFIAYTFWLSRSESSEQYYVKTYRHRISLLMIGGGLTALFFGGQFTVNGAVNIQYVKICTYCVRTYTLLKGLLSHFPCKTSKSMTYIQYNSLPDGIIKFRLDIPILIKQPITGPYLEGWLRCMEYMSYYVAFPQIF